MFTGKENVYPADPAQVFAALKQHSVFNPEPAYVKSPATQQNDRASAREASLCAHALEVSRR